MKARVHVFLKPGVLDPQGSAIERALAAQGFAGIADIRQGKAFDLVVDAADADDARARLDAACQALLANPVIEDWRIEILDGGAPG